MASGTISLGTSGNMKGQIVWSSKSNGTSANTSTVTATLQVAKVTSTTATTGTFWGALNIGGTSKSYEWYGSIGTSWVTVYSFSVTKAHNSNGTGTCYIGGYINGPTGTTLSGCQVSSNKTVTLDTIPRQATLISAPNFTDEENPVIKYSNPAGNAVTTLQACISLTGETDDIAYRNISKTETSYTFELTDAERQFLRSATTGKTRTVVFFVRTVISNTDYHSSLTKTLSIVNADPTLSPGVVDTNEKTIALTGDNNILIKGYSNAQATFNAAALKSATINSKLVTCGGQSLTGDGVISAAESGSFVFMVTDSRGNTATQLVQKTFVEYVKLSCSMSNNRPNADGEMTVKASGNFFNGSFGSVTNTLAVYYRYKASGGTDGSWTAMTVTKDGNTYVATANLTGLDYKTTYIFEAYAVDKLAEVAVDPVSIRVTPVFDWGESDFNFNVPVQHQDVIYDRFGHVINNGLASYTGSGDSAIDPDTTDLPMILTNVNTPMGSGYFMYIHTMFYNTKSSGANRTQIAYPYNRIGSVYHRYYVNGAWSEWRRHTNEDEFADKVIATGSDSNWIRWVKFESGLAICISAAKVNGNFPSTTWGSANRGAGITFADYPFSFSSIPSVYFTKVSADTTTYHNSSVWFAHYGGNTTSPPICFMMRMDSTTIGHPYARCVAIGTWN